MNEIFISLFFLIIGAAIGGFISNRFTLLKNKSETGKLEADLSNAENRIEKLETSIGTTIDDRESFRIEKDSYKDELTKRTSELQNMEQKLVEQKGEVEKIQEKFTIEFENLANKILDKKSEKFTKQNKDNLDLLLNPLQKKIESFEKKVETSQKESVGMHSALKQQLEGLEKLNQEMSKEAINLTNALKGDNKTQGNWGELVLEHVLEKSNLIKDREYFVQQSFTRDDGTRAMPDVVLHLPENKRMVIDSKVSLVAYERYVNENEKDKKLKFLKEHIKSLKNHINELSNKKYEDLYKIQSPDFVLMFIPIEPALYLAQNEDRNFFYTAFNKNILLVSPTTLLSTLRTIDTIWKNEKQQQNAIEIAKHATSLYGKFKNLLDDLELVGNRLKSTNTAYQGAMKKLTGKQNLIKDIDKLENLGVSPHKKIDQKWFEKIEESENHIPLSQAKEED